MRLQHHMRLGNEASPLKRNPYENPDDREFQALPLNRYGAYAWTVDTRHCRERNRP